MERTALSLIDKLIGCWYGWGEHEKYYLTVLAPMIVRSPTSCELNSTEKEIANDLRLLLSPEELEQLPVLIKERRAGRLRDLASDRARREAASEIKRREEEERARLREQQDREQREILRRREQEERERREVEETRLARKRALQERLQYVLQSNFLSADQVFQHDGDNHLLEYAEYNQLKADFVRKWVDRRLRQPVDGEQAAALASTGGDVQVVARAGSGKTKTLVTRAIFLQKHCRVSPSELLLLAFNRKAADEMRNRLGEKLGQKLPHVMTFHALAYALVHPEEQLVYDNHDDADQLGLSREVQDVIDEHLTDKEYGPRIKEIMLAHFRNDWERIVDGEFHLTMEELLAHRRELPRESLKGDYVKSFGEKVIANALFECGVEYKYERNFRWSGVNYRPDFTVPNGRRGGVIIEYFGLQGDSDYDEMSEKKRCFWAERSEWTFLEFSPSDLARQGVDGFVDTLLRKLREAGLRTRRLSEDEIWRLVRRRALDTFTGAIKNFVGRCRKRNLTTDALELMMARHISCSRAEELFLEIGASVYRGYLERLAACGKEDFDGLMWRSVALVRAGQTSFVRDRAREHGDLSRLRFILIDEFQDFSQMFFALANAIRSVNHNVHFFCVGDDWQAINGFAGSDLRFFESFASYFRNTSRCHIRANYRSPRGVVEFGNAVMAGRGPTAEATTSRAGSVQVFMLDDFKPSAAEQSRHRGDEITPAVLRLIWGFLQRGLDVVMLSRRNGLPWYVNYGDSHDRSSNELVRFSEHVRLYLPEEIRGRVTISTAHRYKGLEKAAVILLDAVERSYPLIHPTWSFFRVFGDSIERIEAEERRLFYVAVTRAKDSLVLLSEKRCQSPYLGDIGCRVGLPLGSWDEQPTPPFQGVVHLQVRVSNAFSVKGKLKDRGFRWDAAARYWWKMVLAEGFSFEALLREPWVGPDLLVELRAEDGELLNWYGGGLPDAR